MPVLEKAGKEDIHASIFAIIGIIINGTYFLAAIWAKTWMLWCWEIAQGSCYSTLHKRNLNLHDNTMVLRALAARNATIKVMGTKEDPFFDYIYKITLCVFREVRDAVGIYNSILLSVVFSIVYIPDLKASLSTTEEAYLCVYSASAALFMIFYYVKMPVL